MAENELDGFDNLDDLFSEEKQGGEAAAAAGGDIDKLLGEAPAAEGAAPEGGGASDSELDSFFEDLSTIDDLEVAQEEAPPAAPPPKAEPEAEAEAEAPAPRRAAAPPKVKKKKQAGGGFKRFVMFLIFAGVAGAAGYWFLFPSEEVPWEVTPPAEEKMEMPLKEERPPTPPPPKPQPPPARPAPPPPQPAPQARPAPAPEPRLTGVTYSIQVATCFFPSCVEDFQKRLKGLKVDSRVREKSQSRETIEIYSATTFATREAAQQWAERINRDNRMEGQAYVLQEGNGFRISMGNFTDLGRANIVRDSLNQRLGGEANFTTRVKGIPYKLHYVLGGKYGSRAAADAARQKLLGADARFADSFVIRN